jgi:hypothetical protein
MILNGLIAADVTRVIAKLKWFADNGLNLLRDLDSTSRYWSVTIPRAWMRPGLIEKQEFEYTRHGTVNFLVKWVVHTSRMRGWCLERNDGACLRAVLPQLLEDHSEAHRIHLI